MRADIGRPLAPTTDGVADRSGAVIGTLAAGPSTAGRAVPAGLRPWVETITVTDLDGVVDRRTIAVPPDAAPMLVWRTTTSGRGDLLVQGPRTRAEYRRGKHLPICVQLRLRPGGAQSLLGADLDAVVDRIAPLSELWGRPAHRLSEELVDLGLDPARVLRRIETVLLERLARPAQKSEHNRARAGLVRHALSSLSAGVGRPPARVRDTADRLGISERHLRTLFTKAVGVSPQRFARITRVRSVLAASDTDPAGWSRLAVEAGYYDQSHLTAEFREVMRITPGSFAAGRLPPAASC
ncbi:helix-turn-helix domain-containing protein [Actinoalloteichus hymeniacidonis]|uniref:DNA-binding domain-containing protein, AraC-type n=1 Tax=Actinoalloteichus hymeniacidonis TaxID=340345 RepID=A0AAC9MYA8_9PSEU|nr:AraC family transcriptional regulator [Actinoalloteichus hymeniacidonis]AOS64213.1 DNA-binding domain-containing protein, AraC-type [Actinoalloteichus hymeniacidonis]MBB5907719.1 AraC-like DNA-binding protein [Actinoalloteichus hymeniacidonis]